MSCEETIYSALRCPLNEGNLKEQTPGHFNLLINSVKMRL